MGCGVRVPVRSSALAVVSSYRYSGTRPTPILEKRNRAHVINATVDGRWQFKNGRATQVVAPGDVIVIEKDDSYGCAHTPLAPNSCLIVNLADAALDADAGPIFGRRTLALPMVPALIRRACTADDDEQFHSRVFEIFDFVSASSSPQREPRDRHVFRVQRMKRFIEHHLPEPIALADVASAVGLNPFFGLRIFKRAIGFTPGAYLTKCRVEEAARLLTRSNLGVAAISLRCGFTNQAYFARVFKNYTGLTPTQFRRQAFVLS